MSPVWATRDFTLAELPWSFTDRDRDAALMQILNWLRPQTPILLTHRADGVDLTWEAPVKIKVLLYPSEEGVAVCAPSLPGCWSQGDTREEALENIAVAIREYLESEIETSEGAEVREIEVPV